MGSREEGVRRTSGAQAKPHHKKGARREASRWSCKDRGSGRVLAWAWGSILPLLLSQSFMVTLPESLPFLGPHFSHQYIMKGKGAD